MTGPIFKPKFVYSYLIYDMGELDVVESQIWVNARRRHTNITFQNPKHGPHYKRNSVIIWLAIKTKYVHIFSPCPNLSSFNFTSDDSTKYKEASRGNAPLHFPMATFRLDVTDKNLA